MYIYRNMWLIHQLYAVNYSVKIIITLQELLKCTWNNCKKIAAQSYNNEFVLVWSFAECKCCSPCGGIQSDADHDPRTGNSHTSAWSQNCQIRKGIWRCSMQQRWGSGTSLDPYCKPQIFVSF